MRACADEQFFQFADVFDCSQLGSERTQIEDWIGNELAGPVERDIAATIGLEEFYTFAFKKVSRSDDVLLFRIASEGDHWSVLEQQKCVSDSVVLAHCDERPLQPQCCCVIDHSEIDDGDHGSISPQRH
jgi:hypothetical protein